MARTTGLTIPQETAYDSLICGMITDGVGCASWSGSSGNIDALYILATNTTTTANLNLCNTNFSLTNHGAAFAAGNGYTGNGTNAYLDTGYNPSTAGLNYALNSGSVGVYVLTNRTSAVTYTAISGSSGLVLYIAPYQTSGHDLNCLNCTSGWNSNSTTAQGQYILSRTSSVLTTTYKNGAANGTDTNTPAGLPTATVELLGDNVDNNYWSTDQISAAFISGPLTSTQALHVDTRINNYMKALGINVY